MFEVLTNACVSLEELLWTEKYFQLILNKKIYDLKQTYIRHVTHRLKYETNLEKIIENHV